MTFNPASLLAVRDYVKPRTGLSNDELGISGDKPHAAGGTSYHLGRGDLNLAANPYSVRTARDKAGLSDAASAFDLGMWPRLREFSVWLVARCRSGAADCRDIREVIYSPDGKTVLRWDRQRGVTSQPRAGEADDSHLKHTHISWYRDSETHDRVAVFRAFFDGDDDMQTTDRIGLPAIEGSTQETASVSDALGYTLVRGRVTLEAAKRIEATVSAILAAVKGDKDAEQIIAEIRAQAAAEQTARASEHAELAGSVVAALTPLLGQTGVTQEMVEAALRSVLGSVDGVSPAV